MKDEIKFLRIKKQNLNQKKVTFDGVKVPSVYVNSNKMHKTEELKKIKEP